MALDGTYSGLQASIADFLNRTDLSASIPDFIVLCEAELNRRLRTRLTVARTTASISNQYETLPSDFQSMVSLLDPNGEPMQQLDTDALSEWTYSLASTGGTPRGFALVGSSIQFVPIPSAAMSITMTYRQRIPALASNTSGNWVSLNHPDVYLFGSLAASAPYLQADDRVQVWGDLFNNAVQSILDADLAQYGQRLTPKPSYTQII